MANSNSKNEKKVQTDLPLAYFPKYQRTYKYKRNQYQLE